MTLPLLTKTGLIASLVAMTVSAIAVPSQAQTALTATQAEAAASAALRGTHDANGYYYDPCQRSTVNRTTGGGLLGAVLGAATGAAIAGKRNKTEGAVLGGVLGAAIGASAGNSSAACGSPNRPAPVRNYGSGYGNGPDRSVTIYESRTYYPKHRGHGYDQGRAWDRDGDYSYDRRIEQRSANDGCTLAESPIYLPDGRVQSRFVRVCPDAYGNYQVVN